jgi:thioredoxin 1
VLLGEGEKNAKWRKGVVTIMLCSIFTGAVSADVKDTSENNLSDNTCYTLSQSATPLNNDSLNSEINRLLDANKPVFVFFYADWCHFCDEQKPIIAELEQEYADKIAFFRVNAEENPQAMNEFAVTEFPAMFLIVDKNAEGYLYQEFEGFTDKETLKEGFDFVIVARLCTRIGVFLPVYSDKNNF